MSMLSLDVSKFYTIGHRGAEIGAVENTISAIKYAAELKLDFAEIDIQTSKDGEFIVFHDDQLDQKTNLRGKIADFHSEFLQKTLITTHHGSDNIPKLENVFEILNDVSKVNLKLIIELKSTCEIEKLIILLEKFNLMNRVIIDSFDLCQILELKHYSKEIPTSWLISRGNKFFHNWKRILSIIIKNNFIGASFHQSNISKQMIAQFHKNGKLIFAWGVKRKNDYERLLNLGINGFTAPDPGYLVELIQLRGNISAN